jgi:hypothetical protein
MLFVTGLNIWLLVGEILYLLTHLTTHFSAHSFTHPQCFHMFKWAPFTSLTCFSWLLISITCSRFRHKEVQNLRMFCNLLSCYCMKKKKSSLGACSSYLPQRTWGIKTKTPNSYSTIQYRLTLVTTLLPTSPSFQGPLLPSVANFWQQIYVDTLVSICHLSQLFWPHTIGKENLRL